MYATEKQLQLRVTKRVAKPYNTMPHHVASNPGPLFHGQWRSYTTEDGRAQVW